MTLTISPTLGTASLKCFCKEMKSSVTDVFKLSCITNSIAFLSVSPLVMRPSTTGGACRLPIRSAKGSVYSYCKLASLKVCCSSKPP